MRQSPTDGEEILWYQLRVAIKSSGIKFRRQHPIHPYIVDFVCLQARLVVEVDGSSHDTRIEKDKKRDRHLADMGFEVMRFTNEDVVKDRDAVTLAIINRVSEVLGLAGALP